MNMRDFWAAEAAKMRDTSAVLGKEVLMPVRDTVSKRAGIIFETGFWKEKSARDDGKFTVVCAIKYCNQIKLSNIEACLADAKGIFKGFSKGNYDFELRFEEISSPLFDFSKYKMGGVYSLKELPDGYFMEFVGGVGTGLTESNPSKPFTSSHFYIKSGSILEHTIAGRIIAHESLHPLLDHSWITVATDDIRNNPLASVYLKLRDAIDMYAEDEKKKAGTTAKYIKDKLLEEANIFTSNIMTTPEYVQQSPVNEMRARYIYAALGIKIRETYDFNIMNIGKVLHPLQFDKIVNVVPAK